MLGNLETQTLAAKILNARQRTRLRDIKKHIRRKKGETTESWVRSGPAKRFFSIDQHQRVWVYWSSMRSASVFYFNKPFTGSRNDCSSAESIVEIDCDRRRAFYRKLNGQWVNDADPSGSLLDFLFERN